MGGVSVTRSLQGVGGGEQARGGGGMRRAGVAPRLAHRARPAPRPAWARGVRNRAVRNPVWGLHYITGLYLGGGGGKEGRGDAGGCVGGGRRGCCWWWWRWWRWRWCCYFVVVSVVASVAGGEAVLALGGPAVLVHVRLVEDLVLRRWQHI